MNENVEKIKQRSAARNAKAGKGAALKAVLTVIFTLAAAGGLSVWLIGVKQSIIDSNAAAVNAAVTEPAKDIPETEEFPIITAAPVQTEPPEESAEPQTETETETQMPSREFNGTSAYIAMNLVLQEPELPTGCEITSLTMLLNFYGYDVDKLTMADDYLPKRAPMFSEKGEESYGENFNSFFLGDPRSNQAFGCFAPAITAAAESYLTANGGKHTVLNISGCTPETLYEYVASGTPVVCWGTNGLIKPELYRSWKDKDTGEQLDWYLHEHCFVLTGFDKEKGRVTLNDPIKGIKEFNMERFEQRFIEMGSNAVILLDMNNDLEEFTTTAPEVTEQP